jgi:hypothetical protein
MNAGIPGILLAVSLGVCVAPATADAAHRVCPTERTVVRTASGVVFSRDRDGRRVYYGCLWRVRKTYRLQQVGEYGLNNVREPSSIHLAGRYVAYVQDYGSTGGEANTLSVRDLRTGKVIHQAAVASRGGDFTDQVGTLVLKLNGSVAWTTRTSADFQHPTIEVRAMDSSTVHRAGGPVQDVPRLLDESPVVEPASLRLTADRTGVEWSNNGATRTAPLG